MKLLRQLMERKGPYYIMNAASGIGKRKPSIEDIIEWHGKDSTIIVAVRHHGYDKEQKVFIGGSGRGYSDAKPGDRLGYTIDTGLGHGASNVFTVENKIYIDSEGKIVDKGNGKGVNEKRSYWVMK